MLLISQQVAGGSSIAPSGFELFTPGDPLQGPSERHAGKRPDCAPIRWAFPPIIRPDNGL